MSLYAETLSVENGAGLRGHPDARMGIEVGMEHVADADWEQRIGDFADVCQEQLLCFARSRWPGVTLEPILFSAGGDVVGGCLVMVQRLPLGVGAIAVAKWGPMLAQAGRPDSMALYAGMIERLIDHFARQRRMMLSVMPHAAPMQGNPQFEHLMARGFHSGAGFGFPDRYIVKVRLSDEEQRKSLEQKWRYNLNKSEKSGLSFERAGVDRLGEFDALYGAMTDRKKFPDYSAYDTVPALFAVANPALQPELFFVRAAGGEVVGGAIIFKAGQRAVYLYGATVEKALDLRAGYFMQWNILRWLRDNTGAEWYYLGGTDGFHGLHQFKKGMVGSAGVIRPLPPTANYAAYRLPFMLGEAAFAARELVHAGKRVVDRLRADRARPDQKQDSAR